MNEYLEALVARYRSRGVVIDANLLILYFVGEFDARQIAQQRYLVVTDDFPLSNYLTAIQADVININHLRFPTR